MLKFLFTIWFNFTMAFLFFTHSIVAQDESLQDSKTLFFQNYLLKYGVDFSTSFIGDYFSNLSGGIQKEDSFINNILVSTGIDMNKLAGADGLSLNLSGLGIQGGTFMQNTGAMQGISNIAGVNHWKLYEAWIEQNFLNEDLSILIGLYDLNSEFDVRESSGIFINPSFGIGFDFAQSGENGPSIFPYASLALRINYNLSESFKILTAVFDGVPGSLDDEKGFQVQWNKDEGAMLSTELIFFPSTREFGQNYSKYLIGLWYYTSDFENLSNNKNEKGNFGIYVSGEQFVYAENLSQTQGLALFGRFGIANGKFNQSDFSILGGINYTGLIPERDADVFGLAFTTIHLAEEYKEITRVEKIFETILELTYSFKLLDWLTLQPDLQYVINPIFAQESSYAFTAGLRTGVAF